MQRGAASNTIDTWALKAQPPTTTYPSNLELVPKLQGTGISYTLTPSTLTFPNTWGLLRQAGQPGLDPIGCPKLLIAIACWAGRVLIYSCPLPDPSHPKLTAGCPPSDGAGTALQVWEPQPDIPTKAVFLPEARGGILPPPQGPNPQDLDAHPRPTSTYPSYRRTAYTSPSNSIPSHGSTGENPGKARYLPWTWNGRVQLNTSTSLGRLWGREHI
ncbi:hypothetical protein DSO57_1011779 [Entomophthora muscae]|uniref:Uncharacterized protein n=1 Tax=Entomophthora muscae TaxID=34485 RepID=A0ACC2TGW8_9FUNG|nr:hypothetical protein DSO57_1011779 [Entomophthora muscae]